LLDTGVNGQLANQIRRSWLMDVCELTQSYPQQELVAGSREYNDMPSEFYEW